MKTIMLFLLVASFPATSDNFLGFGDLKIGAQVKSIPNIAESEIIDNSTFLLKKCNMGGDIGIVDNVYVSVQDEKIYKVSFTANESNVAEIERVMKTFVESDVTKGRELSRQVQIFNSSDKRFGFSKVVQPDGSRDYSYYDIDIVTRVNGLKKN